MSCKNNKIFYPDSREKVDKVVQKWKEVEYPEKRSEIWGKSGQCCPETKKSGVDKVVQKRKKSEVDKIVQKRNETQGKSGQSCPETKKSIKCSIPYLWM